MDANYTFDDIWLIKQSAEEYGEKCAAKVTQLKPYQYTEYSIQLIDWIETVDNSPLPQEIESRYKRFHDRIFHFFAYYEYQKQLNIHKYPTRQQVAIARVIDEFLARTDIQIRNMISDLMLFFQL
jgi:hypothetical protein